MSKDSVNGFSGNEGDYEYSVIPEAGYYTEHDDGDGPTPGREAVLGSEISDHIRRAGVSTHYILMRARIDAICEGADPNGPMLRYKRGRMLSGGVQITRGKPIVGQERPITNKALQFLAEERSASPDTDPKIDPRLPLYSVQGTDDLDIPLDDLGDRALVGPTIQPPIPGREEKPKSSLKKMLAQVVARYTKGR